MYKGLARGGATVNGCEFALGERCLDSELLACFDEDAENVHRPVAVVHTWLEQRATPFVVGMILR